MSSEINPNENEEIDSGIQIENKHSASEVGRQCCSTKSFSRKQIVKNVFIICAGVLLLFTAYSGIAMLQSTMNGEQGIGVWAQAITYFFSCVFGIFFPKYVIKKCGTKRTYALAMIAYIPYIASNFFPHWALLFPVSILIGLGSALIWSAQSSYLNDVSVMYVDSIINRKVSKKKFGSILNEITFWSSEKKQNRSASCDLENLKPLFKNDEKNATLNSHETVWLKCINRTGMESTFGIGCSSSVNIQKDRHEANISDQFYPVACENAEYYDVVGSNDTNRCMEANNIVEQLTNNCYAVKKRRKMIESTTARIFGFHGLAYLTCHIWGNLITYFILQSGVDMNAVSNSSCLCGADFCNVASECFEQNIEQPSERLRYVLTGTCVCIAIIAVLIVVFFLDPMEREKKEVTLSMDLLLATYKLAKKKELALLMPASFYIGMMQGFYIGDFTKHFTASFSRPTKKPLLLFFTFV
ncbi:unnamed protein product [Larinioides sclopetarius]|uniref:Uncharacterized protein n=1 Tax=Larinioides sclopetarius TaxID=280406 RepID=A0AAV2BA93_9ARAC